MAIGFQLLGENALSRDMVLAAFNVILGDREAAKDRFSVAVNGHHQ